MNETREKIAALEEKVQRQKRNIYVLFILVISLQIVLISKGYKEKTLLTQVSNKLEIIYEQAIQKNHLSEILTD